MKIVLAGALSTSLLLAACGANQTEPTSQQESLVKKEMPVEMAKENPSESISETTNTEISGMTQGADAAGTEVINSDAAATTTSSNPMLSDSGIQKEIEKPVDEKSQMVMDDAKKEITQKTETIEKKSAEPKS